MKTTKNNTVEMKSGDFLLTLPLLPVNGYKFLYIRRWRKLLSQA
jgi:hypothetical protein